RRQRQTTQRRLGSRLSAETYQRVKMRSPWLICAGVVLGHKSLHFEPFPLILLNLPQYVRSFCRCDFHLGDFYC
ncbi:MAG TPA: hypothetical protein VK797_15360, partial [Tepidisphaeraceae bacterium]|nr:hypothetical protein [Tepidisphaeraceae bacterium]